eukprot:4932306-Amphidinium_carterae.1
MESHLWARVGALFLDELVYFVQWSCAGEEKLSDKLRESLQIVLVASGVPSRSLPFDHEFKVETACIFTDVSAEPCASAEHGVKIVLGGVLFIGSSGVPLEYFEVSPLLLWCLLGWPQDCNL